MKIFIEKVCFAFDTRLGLFFLKPFVIFGYVLENRLEMVKFEQFLDHLELGRYFSASRMRPSLYYIPNCELAFQYPDDQF